MVKRIIGLKLIDVAHTDENITNCIIKVVEDFVLEICPRGNHRDDYISLCS